MRTNPANGEYSGYYRLVESYRNAEGRVCHRTMVNAGYLDDVNADQLCLIQKILTEKVEHRNDPLFKYTDEEDAIVCKYVERFYQQLIDKKKIDIHDGRRNNKRSKGEKVYADSIKNKDVREIGTEWLCYQTLSQLGFSSFLEKQGWSDDDINIAQTHLISRAVFPASELKTSRWIKENSAVCELTGADAQKITKDKLYRIAHKLYGVKEKLENHLSHRTNELFDIEDKILLFDLTNTYFEGRKSSSEIAKFGRSKEKRSDAKLVVLAMVVNAEGFIKYSSILRGNMADSQTLEGMINHLRIKTSATSRKALVVIDAGIATEENLQMIAEKGYDYLCVSRTNITKYKVEANEPTVSVYDNKKRKIELCRVKTERNNDYYLKVESTAKALKERSMNKQFQERFEAEMQKISASLSKKGGVKTLDKVHQRIGRAKQKYPSIQRYYNIDVEMFDSENTEKKSKNNDLVKSIKWSVKENVEINARSGVYFLRTSLQDQDQQMVWTFYNTIREIEAAFRVLKTDLDLRPIYHKTDEATMAHLHLGLLAYWIVNTVRHQLKAKDIRHDWREIRRIMNTQKAVTTTAQNIQDEIISIRRCSEPNEKVRQIYDALHYKYTPYTRKKSVVHKTEIKKKQILDSKESPPG